MHTVPPPVADDPEGEDVSLQEYLGTLLAARWLILGVAVAVLLFGLLYAKFAIPIFRSDVLVQVEEKKKAIAGLETHNAQGELYLTDAVGETGQPVDPAFEYNSGTNPHFLSVAEIKTLLAQTP